MYYQRFIPDFKCISYQRFIPDSKKNFLLTMASSKKIKLSKLRSFRHEEDYDHTYVHTFNTIHNQFDRISESSVNYEDGENFQALPRDFEGFDENDFQALPRNFEGFDENDSVNFKEYTDRFVDMFLQGEAE